MDDFFPVGSAGKDNIGLSLLLSYSFHRETSDLFSEIIISSIGLFYIGKVGRKHALSSLILRILRKGQASTSASSEVL